VWLLLFRPGEFLDHRRHHRFSARFRCWCESDQVTVFTRVANLSESGLFLQTSMPLPVGAVALVRFAGPKSFEVRVRVIWAQRDPSQEPVGMGLQFLELSEAHREIILALSQYQARDRDHAGLSSNTDVQKHETWRK
jgi:uncharacterized protein (TIGR02266 family)